MIVSASGGQPRPRYLPGIAVAVLTVAGYLLIQSGLTTPTPTPAPTTASIVTASVLAPLPSGLSLGGPQLSGAPSIQSHPVVIGTPPPSSGLLHPRPTPTPRHVLHSGPPLH